MKIGDWKQLAEKFRQHFPESGVDINQERMMFGSSSATLEITREGEVKGEMPLHSIDAENIENVKFSEDEVKIAGRDFSYRFRK